MITIEHFLAAEYEAKYLMHYGVIAQPVPPRRNNHFSPMQNAITAFIAPPAESPAKWTCAACGKKRGRAHFWTAILPFRASQNMDKMPGFTLLMGDLLPAFTPVCGSHALAHWDGPTTITPQPTNDT